MSKNSYKKIGVLGGMGPEASAVFYRRIIELFQSIKNARRNDEFPEMLIHNIPSPDNVEAGVDGELRNYLIRSAQLLEKAGMELLAIPCNSAHIHIDAVINSVNIPVMNIVTETALVISKNKHDSILLLSTESTKKSGLYTDQLEQHGISTITLDERDQNTITQNIMDVCDNKVTADTKKSTQDIINRHPEAQGVILGRTEIPLILGQGDINVDCFDTAEILARATFEKCVQCG